tara:strand:- start:2962 stop:3162 length:201 start_codon:yes stop_codon:yes gene_type:complete
MFNIDMDEELDKFYRDKNRFKNLKKMLDFKFNEEEFKGKGIKINQPKFKKKLTTSKFIKTNKKGLF